MTCTGTDQKHLHNTLPWAQSYPGVLGHESVGQVISLGAKVKQFAVGDLVLRPTAVYPGDAWRFFDAIRPAAERLGIPEAALWRRK